MTVSKRISVKEQEEFNKLLQDMMEELQSFPGGTMSSTVYHPNNNNIYPDQPQFTRGVLKSRSFSHSPAARSKPLILQHFNSNVMPVSSSKFPDVNLTSGGSQDSHRRQHLSINHEETEQATDAFKTNQEASRGTPTVFSVGVTGAFSPLGGNQSSPTTPSSTFSVTSPPVIQLQPQLNLSSRSSPVDRTSRGVSRSVTLTPTTMTNTMTNKPISAQIATLKRLKDHSPSSQAKPLVVSSVSPSRVTPFASGPSPSFKGTSVVPGGQIDLSDEANRVGVYASTLGKKKLSRNEREELDDLINVMLDEVRHFPDAASIRRSNSSSSKTIVSGNQKGNHHRRHLPSSSNESVATSGRSRNSPPNSFSSGLTRSGSKKITIPQVFQYKPTSPVSSLHPFVSRKHHVPASDNTNTYYSKVTPSSTRFKGKSIASPESLYDMPSVTPPPPHLQLLRRPTDYHATVDSKPFSYGVTAASPLIRRRRIHSESTAYVSENRPVPPKRQDSIEDGYELIPRESFYPVNGGEE